MGFLRWQQGDFPSAVSWLARALQITMQFEMAKAYPLLMVLARLYDAMGEVAFSQAWHMSLPGEAPPIAAMQVVLKQMEEGKASGKQEG